MQYGVSDMEESQGWEEAKYSLQTVDSKDNTRLYLSISIFEVRLA
jgi:hypothetical protein